MCFGEKERYSAVSRSGATKSEAIYAFNNSVFERINIDFYSSTERKRFSNVIGLAVFRFIERK